MKTEKTLSIFLILGLILKFNNISGGTILTALVLFIFALIYLFGSFYFLSIDGVKNQKIILTVFSGVFFSFVPLGILFKIQFWPGGTALLFFGSLINLLLYFIVLKINKIETELVGYYKNLRFRAVLFVCLSSIIFLIPKQEILKLEYGNNTKLIHYYNLYTDNPDNIELQNQYFEYLDKLNKNN